MTTMEYYISSLLVSLKERNIKRIICTNSVVDSKFILTAKESGFLVFEYEDARSVGYIGTGMCSEAMEPVIICTNSDNEYRSLMPAMTEAYYRNLPILIITLTTTILLDSLIEINDISYKNVRITCHDKEDEFSEKIQLILAIGKVVHVDLDLSKDCEFNKKNFSNLSRISKKTVCDDLLFRISSFIDNDCAVFLDSDISCPKDKLKYIRVICDGAGGHEGRMAYVLGASLSQQKKKYIGILTEKSALHDINTLGNREMNNRVVYIVLAKEKGNLIRACAENLGFNVRSVSDIESVALVSDKPELYLIEQ